MFTSEIFLVIERKSQIHPSKCFCAFHILANYIRISNDINKKFIEYGKSNSGKYYTQSQYFVWPPLAATQADNLLGIELYRDRIVSLGILFHSSTITLQRSSREWGLLWNTFSFRMCHTFSMTLRSGLWAGHDPKTRTSSLDKNLVVEEDRCAGAPSCWNAHPGQYTWGRPTLKTLWYSNESTFLLHLTITRAPSPRMAPQTIMYLGNLTVERMYLAFNLDPMFLRTYIRRFGLSSSLHSSEKTTFPHFSTDQDNLSWDHANRFLRWPSLRYGFRIAMRPNRPFLLSVRLTVPKDTRFSILASWRTSLAVEVGVPLEILTSLRSSRSLRIRFLPLFGRSLTSPVSLNFLMMYWTERLLILRTLAISFWVTPSWE